MYKHIILLLALICCTFAANGQRIKTITATRQDWSGGIAGHSGSNYAFIVEFYGFKNAPLPDTLWLDGKPTPLSLTISNKKLQREGNMLRTAGKDHVRFEFNVFTRHDEYAESNNLEPSGKRKELSRHQPVLCSGVALLSYKCNGRQLYYQIHKYTNILPALNYP